MNKPISAFTPETCQAYDAAYFQTPDGQPRSWFVYDPKRDDRRARAIAQAAGVTAGSRVIDFGCGPGVLTAAFNTICPTVGVDPSSAAVANVIPEARGRVHHLGDDLPLWRLPNNLADLAVAKDVFEHIREGRLHDVAEHLACIARQVLVIVPTTDEARQFVCPLFEQDKTHVTRLTKEEWLGFFPHARVIELEDLTPQVRPSRQVSGTLCMLLRESDETRQRLMSDRERLATPLGYQLCGRISPRFDDRFNELLNPNTYAPERELVPAG